VEETRKAIAEADAGAFLSDEEREAFMQELAAQGRGGECAPYIPK
jgi:hypothetical protein